jgi:hypothetical protein
MASPSDESATIKALSLNLMDIPSTYPGQGLTLGTAHVRFLPEFDAVISRGYLLRYTVADVKPRRNA